MTTMQDVKRAEMLSDFKICASAIILVTIFLTIHPVVKHVVIRVTNPQFKLFGPYYMISEKLEALNSNDIYEHLIDLKNFKFKINPHVCLDSESTILLLILISSRPENFRERTLIRTTWGQTYDATRVVFLIGETEEHLRKLIEDESSVYEDIVQGSFKDAYRNSTYKHAMGLKWVSHHCSKARYVLKVNDDSVINSREVERFLVRELSPWGANGLIACKVYNRYNVQHSKLRQWRLSIQEYAGTHHPNFCAGDFILYSQDVVKNLLAQVQSLPFFWMDDVLITGIAAEMQQIARTPLGRGLILSHAGAKLITYQPRYNFLFGPSGLKSDQIKGIWMALNQGHLSRDTSLRYQPTQWIDEHNIR